MRRLYSSCATVLVALFTSCGHKVRAQLPLTTFINSITLTGRTIVPNGATPEDLALTWLISSDPNQFVPTNVPSITNTRIEQRYALLTLWFQHTGQRPWRFSSSWLNADECTWYGIFCGTTPPNTYVVQGIAMGSNLLYGTIPIEFGLLSSLVDFNVYWANLRGTIPSSLAKWTNIVTASFSLNELGGTIPSELGNYWKKIEKLDFSNNPLTGTLPTTIGQWGKLRWFNALGNRLTGPFPPTIFLNCAQLSMFSVAGSKFTGTIPLSTSSNYPELWSMNFGYNNFNGTIPSSIGNMTRLAELYLWNNYLSGTIPSSIGSLKLMKTFVGNNNQLTGSIPSSIANWVNIVTADFRYNLFNGTVPIGICSQTFSLYADCPAEVKCWCCSNCPAPPPTRPPTRSPTKSPTRSPTKQPVVMPIVPPVTPVSTRPPTRSPTKQPVVLPIAPPAAPVSTRPPTRPPTKQPVVLPIAPPAAPVSTRPPTRPPTKQPVAVPIAPPAAPVSTRPPTRSPTKQPAVVPIALPVSPPQVVVPGAPPTVIPAAPRIPPIGTPAIAPSPIRLPSKPTIPNIITFSEHPYGTQITKQYAGSNGVIFGNAITFFEFVEYANESLSGSPFLKGDITGYFVKSAADGMYQNSTVRSFNLTLHSYGRVGSTRVEWFDPSGVIINQITNRLNGTEQLFIQGGNIASFRIGIIDGVDNAGFVIDNFISTPVTSGILFRELRADVQDGSWGPGSINIPGFDHVALNYGDSVFESHPGYTNANQTEMYVSADGLEKSLIASFYGVQNNHSRATFRHNSPNVGITPVKRFEEIPIDDSVALSMKNLIEPKVRKSRFLGFSTIEQFVTGHVPEAQKGRDDSFSGCGLIEWAAERAGVNDGRGFIPNALESITTENGVLPMLSPELMYFALQNQELVFSTIQTIKGYFDPVDYVVTDPLGRRSGLVNRTRYDEIPNAVPTPKGDVETLVISNPIPGTYTIKVMGIPGQKGVAAVEVDGRPSQTVRTTGNASIEDRSIEVPVVSGSRGDVNGDGVINQKDLEILQKTIPRYVSGIANTGDMNGDRQLNQIDVNWLTQYLNRPPANPPTRAPVLVPARAPTSAQTRAPTKEPTRAPTRAPTLAPAQEVTTTGECPTADQCSRGFYMHRTRFSRCSDRCASKLAMRFRLRLSSWKCGNCPR